MQEERSKYGAALYTLFLSAWLAADNVFILFRRCLSSFGSGGGGTDSRDDFEVIVISQVPWDYLWQRNHHTMSRLSSDRRVLYCCPIPTLTAAKEGHADSQFNVGLMYEKGIGVGKDEKEAVAWYSKSAEQGNSAAQYNLGVLYENGLGTGIDYAKANEWYRKASVQGDALAIGNLGMLYVRGQGVKENKVAGVALLLVSATMDASPENHARQNISATRGLTTQMIAEAQTLSGEMSSAQNLLVPLDQYLKETDNSNGNQ